LAFGRILANDANGDAVDYSIQRMTAKPKTIDDYLKGANTRHRAALEKIRKTIRAAAPQAEECISYGLAAFRLNGRPLMAFGAWANHCALYPMSSRTVKAFQDQLEGFAASKGTIRFTPEHPLPVALVRKLVKARVAENARRDLERAGAAVKRRIRAQK
jgi:uncharacterized protein YdhG (YjbR/CyaY superfamily)